MANWKFIERHASGAGFAWHKTKLPEGEFLIGITGKPYRAIARHASCRVAAAHVDGCQCRDFVDGAWVPVAPRQWNRTVAP